MRHGKTAFQNWQLAGCPTIPQKLWGHGVRVSYGPTQAEEKAHMDARAAKLNTPKRGLMHHAKRLIGALFGRRGS